METEDEKRAKLENDAATKRIRLVMETEEKRKARLNYHTALVGQAEDEEVQKNGMDWIWI